LLYTEFDIHLRFNLFLYIFI